MARCTICHTLIKTGNETARCSECDNVYHQSCWDEMGGCATYGCSEAPVAEKTAPTSGHGRGWGDTKACPVCNREINSSLLMCFCGARFPYADPMTHEAYSEYLEDLAARKRARNLLLMLFFFTGAGFPGPITGPLAGIYAYQKRGLLTGQAGSYVALGIGTALLGACYAAIFALLALGL